MTNILVRALLVLVLFQISCSPHPPEAVTEPVQQVTTEPTPATHPMVPKIAAILQEGWSVTQDGNTIRVTRREPVTLYNNVALPPRGEGLTEVMKNGNRVRYEITLELDELISKAKVREMSAINEKTEYELKRTGWGMDAFKAKDGFDPKTDRDRNLFAEYQQQLRNLPYYRLPDLHDSQNSYYISTNRSRRQSFSYPREERECRAVLGYIYSFADAYEDFTASTNDDEFKDHYWDRQVDAAFMNGRDYDSYISAKDRDLTGQK